MKKLSSCLCLLLILNSCSSEPPLAYNTPLHSMSSNGEIMRNAADMPANSDNPYDVAGRVHNEILYAYYNTWPLPVGLDSIQSHVMRIAVEIPDFIAIKSTNYHSVSLTNVASLLADPNNCIVRTVNSSLLSTLGKASLIEFANHYLEIMSKEDDYSIIYEDICSYEANVAADVLLTASDKRSILITTSIARYTAKPRKKKPKKNTDPDWDMLVGGLMAGFYGAENDTAEAVATALITGIAQNPQF